MASDLCVMEFKSIAKAHKVLDNILKKYSIYLLKAKKICPGKFILIFYGRPEDIDDIILEYKNENSILSIHIPCVSKKTINAINGILQKKVYNSLSIVETNHAYCSFLIADDITKKYSIDILKLDCSIGMFGKGVIYFGGSLSNIEESVRYINNNIEKNKIHSIEIISNPNQDLIDLIK